MPGSVQSWPRPPRSRTAARCCAFAPPTRQRSRRPTGDVTCRCQHTWPPAQLRPSPGRGRSQPCSSVTPASGPACCERLHTASPELPAFAAGGTKGRSARPPGLGLYKTSRSWLPSLVLQCAVAPIPEPSLPPCRERHDELEACWWEEEAALHSKDSAQGRRAADGGGGSTSGASGDGGSEAGGSGSTAAAAAAATAAAAVAEAFVDPGPDTSGWAYFMGGCSPGRREGSRGSPP